MSDNYARIAIVTGTTSGIGEATVRKFVAAGFGVLSALARRLLSLLPMQAEVWADRSRMPICRNLRIF